MNDLIFILIIGAIGIGLCLIAVLLASIDSNKNILKKYIKPEKEESRLDRFLDTKKIIIKFEDKISKKYRVIEDRFPVRKITKITIISMIIGIIFSIFIRNLIIIPFILIMCYLTPQLYLSMVKSKEQNRMEKELGNAIRFFRTEFTTTQSVPMALQNIIPKLNEPVKKYFEILSKEINYGIDPKIALCEFKKNVNDKFASIFANLLISYFEKGTAFGDSIIDISTKINNAQLRNKDKQVELSTMRVTNYILNFVLAVSIIIIYFVSPSIGIYFKQTIQGQLIMTLAIISGFVSLLLGFKISDK